MAVAAAAGPRPERPDVYHVASGVGTRCATASWSTWSRTWFTEHPLYDERRPAHRRCPNGRSPGAGRVQRQLRRATTAWTWPNAVLTSLPMRGEQAEWRPPRGAAHPGRAGPRLRRALRRLHRDRGPLPGRPALALWDRLDADDQAAFCFDPAVIDWDHYVHDVHLPSVVEHARVRTTPGRSTPDRGPTGPAAASSPPTATWPPSTSRTPSSPPTSSTPTPGWPAGTSAKASGPAFVADLMREAPSLLALDRRDRGDFLRSFYRRYEGASVDAGAARGRLGAVPPCCWPSRSRPGSPGCAPTAALGHRTCSSPAPSTSWSSRCGRCSTTWSAPGWGARRQVHRPLERAPPDRRGPGPGAGRLRRGTGSLERVGGLRRLGSSDLPMLEAVGFPVAVNPETGWPPSPGAGAGTSSTGTRPRRGAARSPWAPRPRGVSGRGTTSRRVGDPARGTAR
jgi:fatty acyl-CoA reductase